MAEGGGARTELDSWSPHRVTPSPELVQGCRPTCVLGSWTQPTYLQLPWKVLCEPGAVLPSESPSVLRSGPSVAGMDQGCLEGRPCRCGAGWKEKVELKGRQEVPSWQEPRVGARQACLPGGDQELGEVSCNPAGRAPTSSQQTWTPTSLNLNQDPGAQRQHGAGSPCPHSVDSSEAQQLTDQLRIPRAP